MPALTRVALVSAALVVGVGCRGPKPEPGTPDPATVPLSGIVAQNLIVAPVQALRFATAPDEVAPPAKPFLARLDSVIADTLRSRVANQGWVYADAVIKSAANNPTYATDPRALAVNSLRSPALKLNDRLPEPVASQLRTMIAFHDARLVLVPLDLTVERTPTGASRPVVHLVLVDPRSSVVRWIGRFTGPDSPTVTQANFAIIASRLADLFVPR
jgi:hypothetical protein